MLDVEKYQHRGGGGGSGRSRRRERPPLPAFGEWADRLPGLRTRGGVAGDRLLAMDGARGGEGNGQNRQQVNALTSATDCSSKKPMQLNMLAFEHTRGSSKKVSGTSIKMLIDQEMSKDMKSRRHSPNVVAKLMGLDSLPAQQPKYMRKESVSCFHKGSSEGFPGKHLVYDYENPQEDFKDVFEVVETKMTEEPGNWPVQKRSSKARQKHKKMDYLRQKFMAAKQLSTDEKTHNSKQFSEALEVLESNKDLFLKLLQEPSSLFVKHLEEYQSASTPLEASHIMILKSYDVTGYENNDIQWRSERQAERITHIERNIVDKYESDFVSHCIKEHNISLSKKLLKNKLEGKRESSSLPTHIVVLKPSLENVHESICRENLQLGNSGYRRRRELRRSVTQEMFPELREQQILSDDVVVKQRTKGSREIAKEISKHMMNTVIDGSVKTCGSGHSVWPRHKHSRRMPGASTFMGYETLRRSSNRLEKSRSLAYSTETSVSREARKHLSERWKMTHKFQEVGPADQGTSTLGEMLALSDREMPDMPLSSLPCQRSSLNKIFGKEALARWGSPWGISSRDAWKNECPSLPRSRSLPASSSIYCGIHGASDNDDNSMLKNVMNLSSRKSSEGSLFNERLSSSYDNAKMCSNSPQQSDYVVDENTDHMWEINVDQDEFQSGLGTKKLSKKKATVSETKDHNNSDTSYLIDSVPDVCGEGAELPWPTDEQQLPHSVVSAASVDTECLVICDQKENVTEEKSSNESHAESVPHAMGQACFPPVKVAEHPSPISVLEPTDENESSPECFERVNADLQELRVQLQLLKSESRDTGGEGLVVLSGVDTDIGSGGALQAGGNQLIFNDEENMEFCYLLDVLTESGFHNADLDMLSSAYFLPESPIGPDVFEKLEVIYNQFTWSRTDRKLLFDLVNSVLAEILAPSVDPHPWIKPRRIQPIGFHRHLADELWKSVVRVTKDATDDAVGTGMEDLQWLDLGDGIDAVGRKIERMLNNDLLDELVNESMSLDGCLHMQALRRE